MKNIIEFICFTVLSILLTVLVIYINVQVNMQFQKERNDNQLTQIKNGKQWVEYDSQGNPFWVYKKD